MAGRPKRVFSDEDIKMRLKLSEKQFCKDTLDYINELEAKYKDVCKYGTGND